MRTKFKYFIFSVFVCTGLWSCQESNSQLPFFNSADFKPEWIPTNSDKYNSIHKIDEFSFVDQEGRTITNQDFDGKIYVADFFFTTCPGICPQMTDNMKILQEKYKHDDKFKLISHSVTPWLDTVAQLKRYADLYEVDPSKWHLVTGPTDAIYNLARQSYFAEKEIGLQLTEDDFLHTENFLLIDPKRRIRGIYNGTVSDEIDRIEHDIKILQEEL